VVLLFYAEVVEGRVVFRPVTLTGTESEA